MAYRIGDTVMTCFGAQGEIIEINNDPACILPYGVWLETKRKVWLDEQRMKLIIKTKYNTNGN